MVHFILLLHIDPEYGDCSESPNYGTAKTKNLRVYLRHRDMNTVECSCYKTGVAQRVDRGIALLFHDCSTRGGWVVSSMPQPHFTHCTHCTGGLVGPRAGLDGRKISSPPGFDPGPSSPYSVAIPTELPGPHMNTVANIHILYTRLLKQMLNSCCRSSTDHSRDF